MVLKWALARDLSALPVRPLLRWCAIATLPLAPDQLDCPGPAYARAVLKASFVRRWRSRRAL